jgi:protein-tyrosine phosphatase
MAVFGLVFQLFSNGILMKTLGTILVGCLIVGYCSIQQSDERHVPLDGQPNFRDIGGYKTTDDKTVKWRQVYRSGELPRLTNNDVEKLKELGIKTVVNFLTENETKARGKDHLPGDTDEVSLPIESDGGLVGVVLEARKTADFSKVPVELNPELHRLLVREANQQYAAFLRELADPKNRPLIFHCSHGVHRTGTAAAILLSALGVPWETVRKDYLLSNEYRKEEVTKRLEQLRELAAKNQGIPVDRVDMANINAFYILQPAYIDASLDETVKQYGSMENYIRDGLGITTEEIKSLRDSLLER